MVNNITFNGSRGFEEEECPKCHEMKWLGECDDGSKMCQDCFFEEMDEGEMNYNL